MKRLAPAFFIILCLVVFTGMAGRPTDEVPTPAVDFRATVVDNQDIATKCTNLSWEGKTFFRAQRGKGVITIPFEKVKKVTMMGEEEEGVNARVLLRSGEAVAVTFDRGARVLGQTAFGTYRIEVKDTKEIIFE